MNWNPDQDYADQWLQVQKAENEGLTQNAEDSVRKIYQKAKEDQNAPQVVKSLLHLWKYTTYKEENSQQKVMNEITEEIKKAQEPLQSVLQNIQANLYWQYYQNNRYRILNRTEIANNKPEDFQTWDANTIIGESIRLYQASLKNKELLQKTKIETFKDILVENEKSKEYRPTLYDLLAHDALDFFMSSESNVTTAADQFQITQKAAFDPARDFVNHNFTTTDPLSTKFYAIKVFQDLVRFHLNDENPTALVDADLKRLDYVRDNSILPNKDELYLEGLKALENNTLTHPSSAMASYNIAKFHSQKGDKYHPINTPEPRWEKKKALELCDATIARHPNSRGSNNCASLKENIMRKNLQFTLENANLPEQPFRAFVSYQNVSKVYAKVAAITQEDEEAIEKLDKTEQQLNYLNRLKVLDNWTVDLPNEGDYQSHNIEISIPNQKVGRYVVMLATTDNYSMKKEAVTFQYTVVTNLSTLKNGHKNTTDFFAVHRKTSEPIDNVKFEIYARKYDYKTRKYEEVLLGQGTSNFEGKFSFNVNQDRNYYSNKRVVMTKGDDRYSYNDNLYYRNESPQSRQTRTFFFTDRSIYRPGQTVYFKGLMLTTDGKNSDLVLNKTTKVELYDVNYQKVTELELKTNDYGTFNGKFTLPTGVLNGRMTIKESNGSTDIQVEEYKRPKFEVSFNPIEGSYRLNETVKATGLAKAYAGSVIDGAEVKYRVVRRASFPYWFRWWIPYPASSELEVTNGVTKTNEKGEFEFEFTAIPDASIDSKQKPQYTYTLYADVTDISGETRSSESSVSVGYISLLASVSVPNEVNRDSTANFKVSTTNLGGEFEAVDVKIAIHELKQPERVFRTRRWEQPDQFVMSKEEYYDTFEYDVYKDENRPANWEKGKKVFEQSFKTAKDSKISPNDIKSWSVGKYVLELTTKDKYGEEVKFEKYFDVFSFLTDEIPLKEAFWHTLSQTAAEPNETIVIAYGSALPNTKILFEVEHDQKIVERKWLTANKEQNIYNVKVLEKYRGNFAIHLSAIRNNEAFTESHNINVPWNNKDLKIELSSFRNKLYPGAEEQWTVKISGMKGEKVAAELLASMYDASLDAFKYHGWSFGSIYPTYYGQSRFSSDSGFGVGNSQLYAENWNEYDHRLEYQNYDQLNWFDFSLYGYRYYGRAGGALAGEGRRYKAMSKAPMPSAAPAMEMEESAGMEYSSAEIADDSVTADELKVAANGAERDQNGGDDTPTETDFEDVQVRTNLNETAFFFPELRTNEKGEVMLSFTAPEALTRWKFMAFGHTKDLKYGQMTEEIVTQKDLMVMPNAPRFFRESDDIVFASKISNLTDKEMNGTAVLQLFDALTMKPIDKKLGNTTTSVNFTAKAEQSTAVNWKLKIPKDIQAVTYRVIAKSGKFSDGEESSIPVLTNRMLVTESMPLPVRGQGTKEFTFEKLNKSEQSSTLQNERLTLEFTSQPAWYAVQALPYLMEYPHECAEQIFSRFYANSIASHIANSDPKIAAVFKEWEKAAATASLDDGAGNESGALLSNLEKNQELKSLLLQETPWVLQAKDESERKRRVGVLFDIDRMRSELTKSLKQLQQMQVSNGGWSWFPGMPESRYITQHIVSGLGHLDNLGIKNVREDSDTWNMTQKAVQYLDMVIQEDYDNLLKYKANLKEKQIGNVQIQYLYARSFFKDIPVDKSYKTAFDYYQGQAAEYWLSNNKYLQGMIALALHRFTNGDSKTANGIIESLRQNSVNNEEMGMYFKDMANGWYWYQAPIESQSLLIEAFNEVAKDEKSVNDMKVWLLKQKQTQDWKTTKATAEACYALILTGDDWLSSDEIATITVGGKKLDPKNDPTVSVEAGTGYFKKTWDGEDVTADMGKVTVTKNDKGVAWGAMYWQYFEQLDKITFAETPLSIKKELFLEENTKNGPKLTPLTDNAKISVGDKVKVRIEIRVDRDMEYVHLKDMRASGFEPMNVISSYKYQDGLGYYESTKDAATNFFMSWLPKGTYVFEYPLRATHQGDFSNGITTMQCMYAPEFTSHSEGIRVVIGE
ncbi:MAG: alpha-2-macroglobulin family protein [Chitinophagales bacterium]